jgi:hypothetical protein
VFWRLGLLISEVIVEHGQKEWHFMIARDLMQIDNTN